MSGVSVHRCIHAFMNQCTHRTSLRNPKRLISTSRFPPKQLLIFLRKETSDSRHPMYIIYESVYTQTFFAQAQPNAFAVFLAVGKILRRIRSPHSLCVYVCRFICINVYIIIHTYTHKRMYKHTYLYIHIHIYIYIYICT